MGRPAPHGGGLILGGGWRKDGLAEGPDRAAGRGALPPPGAAFGERPAPARPLDQGMGLAVARRTVFRPEDQEDFGRVADRVAEGNMSLLGPPPAPEAETERARLRNAIASGALLTSGRHLQHGDATQARRPMELFVNCATAIASFTCFYLLLNGAGVGRAYDDELVAVDWADAPTLLLHLSPAHPDFPRDRDALRRFGVEFGLLPPGLPPDAFDEAQEATVRAFLAAELAASDTVEGAADAVRHRVEDSREGWAKAVELLEAMAFRRERHRTLLLDLSAIRPRGAPIRGMQGRPAPGPLSLLRGLHNLRRHVIEPARARDPAGEALQPWEQAMLVDHHLSVEVQGGGARRAARMATKSWRDPGALRFVRLKEAGGLWTANHSVTVDAEFWHRVRRAEAGRDSTTPGHGTPGRCSRRRHAVPGSTASRASSTATCWRTTVPAPRGDGLSGRTAARCAARVTAPMRRSACWRSCRAALPAHASR